MCVEIGKRLGIVKDHGKSSLENVSNTFYYIPLLKQLEALLQNDYILSQVHICRTGKHKLGNYTCMQLLHKVAVWMYNYYACTCEIQV